MGSRVRENDVLGTRGVIQDSSTLHCVTPQRASLPRGSAGHLIGFPGNDKTMQFSKQQLYDDYS
jgi:hypothetical protein